MNGRNINLVISVALIACFCTAALHLFLGRFRSGDSFPAYSTLRSDPFGAKVVYMALERLPNVQTRRNFRPLEQLQLDSDSALVLLGLTPISGSAHEHELGMGLSRFVMRGGRLILTMFPSHVTRQEYTERMSRKEARDDDENSDENADDEQEEVVVEVDPDLPFWMERWEIDVDYSDIPHDADEDVVPAPAAGIVGAAETTVQWYSTQVFTNFSEEWEPVLTTPYGPVLMERTLGAGSIVIATDSFFVSNEAMWKERDPVLIDWLFDGRTDVIFNETHHWLTEKTSIAGLAREYRLHGGALALLVFVILFVWRSNAPLLPVRVDSSDRTLRSHVGKDHFSGLVNIIRRGLAPGRLVDQCVDEWKKSETARVRPAPELTRRISDTIAQHRNKKGVIADPIRCYNDIANLIIRSRSNGK